jgi:hypothetical protein
LDETAEPDFGDFRIDFLGEYEAICKTASALGGIVGWKKEGRKSCDTFPFPFP